MSELITRGCHLIGGPFAAEEMPALASAYDSVLASLDQNDVRYGSTSIRFGRLAAHHPFYYIYTYKPLLELAASFFGSEFKLSSFSGRTLLPGANAPPLHQDVKPGSDGDPLLGFIFMIDDFTPENGATRYLPASQRLLPPPSSGIAEQQMCGPAGSIALFDGTLWHEHGANFSESPRRSIQGYFVRKDHTAAVRWSDEVSGEKLFALPNQARELLAP